MNNLVCWFCPARFIFFVDSCGKDSVSTEMAHIWSFSLTFSSCFAFSSSIELPHAIPVFKHKSLRKLLSAVQCQSSAAVLYWFRSSIWGFAETQETEISLRTTLVFQLILDGHYKWKEWLFVLVNLLNFHNVLMIWSWSNYSKL